MDLRRLGDMSKDPDKKSKSQQRKEVAARLAKFTPEDNEKVSRAVRANKVIAVTHNGQIGPGLNNLYAEDLKSKKVDVDLTRK